MRALLDAAGNPAPIEVDGGIDTRTVDDIVTAGADILVAGSAVFGSRDPETAARQLKAQAQAAAARRAGVRA
jgi:ribulose-phosphate 3-epimerase